ncbi:phage tail tip lysozyme [Lactobacillus sp. ESL0234]|uniref:phage tail tip lysozyme n=1 Tax=Lactobacillus sp. ESL0234 TaxID=2069355 RepID=UPI000EFCFE0A|nr:phage tail tip lysozyme [Lactobacillus sp. ESL0234]RMC42584.1 hypothetical protein F5ESL0234_07810 [Lactobacillus sp. ESL0234]
MSDRVAQMDVGIGFDIQDYKLKKLLDDMDKLRKKAQSINSVFSKISMPNLTRQTSTLQSDTTKALNFSKAIETTTNKTVALDKALQESNTKIDNFVKEMQQGKDKVDAFTKELEKSKNKADDFNKSVKNTDTEKIEKASHTLRDAFSSSIIGNAVTNVWDNLSSQFKNIYTEGMAYNGLLGKIDARFKNMGFSDKFVKQLDKQLDVLKYNTNMNDDQVANVQAKMLNWSTIGNKGAMDITKTIAGIGDSSKLDGQTIENLASGLMRVGANGKVSYSALNRVAKSAPTFYAALAKGAGMSENSLKNLLKTGDVTQKQFQTWMASASKYSDKAFEAYGNTQGGAIGQMKKRWEELEGTMTKPLFSAKSSGLQALKDIMLSKELKNGAKTIGNGISDIVITLDKHKSDISKAVKDVLDIGSILGKDIWKDFSTVFIDIGQTFGLISKNSDKSGNAFHSFAEFMDSVAKNKTVIEWLAKLIVGISTVKAADKITSPFRKASSSLIGSFKWDKKAKKFSFDKGAIPSAYGWLFGSKTKDEAGNVIKNKGAIPSAYGWLFGSKTKDEAGNVIKNKGAIPSAYGWLFGSKTKDEAGNVIKNKGAIPSAYGWIFGSKTKDEAGNVIKNKGAIPSAYGWLFGSKTKDEAGNVIKNKGAIPSAYGWLFGSETKDEAGKIIKKEDIISRAKASLGSAIIGSKENLSFKNSFKGLFSKNIGKGKLGGILQSVHSTKEGFGGLSTAGKLATGAAAVGVAADAGLSIYKGIKAKAGSKERYQDIGAGIGSGIGGGIGLYFGGPLGAAMGSQIGKVVGGWGGQAVHSFKSGWQSKKPPKNFWSIENLGWSTHDTVKKVSAGAKSAMGSFKKGWDAKKPPKNIFSLQYLGWSTKHGGWSAIISDASARAAKSVQTGWNANKPPKNFWSLENLGWSAHSMWNGLKSSVTDVIKWFKDKWNGLVSWFDNIKSNLSNFGHSIDLTDGHSNIRKIFSGKKVGSHALGSRGGASHYALVGEAGTEIGYHVNGNYARLLGANGPEIVKIQAGENILPAGPSAKILNGGLGKGMTLPGYANGKGSPKAITAGTVATPNYAKAKSATDKYQKDALAKNRKFNNSLVSDSNKLDKFHVGSFHFAGGTDWRKQYVTPAILNDGNDSPATGNREGILNPNGTVEVVKGRNAKRWLMPWQDVIKASDMAKLAGQPVHFANGTKPIKTAKADLVSTNVITPNYFKAKNATDKYQKDALAKNRKFNNSLVSDSKKLADKRVKNNKLQFDSLERDTNKSFRKLNKQWSSSWDDITDDFKHILNRLPDYTQDALNGVVGQLNKGFKGINSALGQFGGNDHVLSMIHYANGTDKPVERPHLAVLNDSPRALRQETIVHANGSYEFPQGNNVVRLLHKGDSVLNGEDTFKAQQQGILPFYAEGKNSHSALQKLAENNAKNYQAGFNRDFTNNVKVQPPRLQQGVTILGKNAAKPTGFKWYQAMYNFINSLIHDGAGGTREAFLNYAKEHFSGKKYVMGATGPDAYDCSGMVSAALSHFGIDIGRTTVAMQESSGVQSLGHDFSRTVPGDLVIYGHGGGAAGHVGIINSKANNSMFNETPPSARVTSIDTPKSMGYEYFRVKGLHNASAKTAIPARLTRLVKSQLSTKAINWIKSNLSEDALGGSVNLTGDIGQRARALAKALMGLDHNATKNGIAAILGNWFFESRLDSGAVNSDGGASGLGQWLGGRLSNLRAFAKSHGKSWTNPAAQLKFALSGEGSDSSIFKSVLEGHGSVADLANKFSSKWERGGYNAEHVNGARQVAGALRGLRNGGHVKAGERVRVNEDGIESFRPDVSGTVIPHAQTIKNINNSAKKAGNVTINQNITVHATGTNASETKAQVKDAVDQANVALIEKLQELMGFNDDGGVII